MDQKEVSQVSLPKSLVRDPTIKPLEFCILLRFKFMAFQQKSSDIEVDINKLKSLLCVADNRTIKAGIKNLTKQGYILNDVEFKKQKPSFISLNKKKMAHGNNFTRLPTYLISKIESIGHTGLRLLYYYESYIIRGTANKQFAYPSFKTICRDTKISPDTLDKYNDLLVNEKLLKIQKFEPDFHYSGTHGETVTLDRFNNHYDVRLDRILFQSDKA